MGGHGIQHRLDRMDLDDDLMGELVLGLVYAWKKGALDWE